MQVLRSLKEFAQIARMTDRCVATIGSFDGIHLAHQELLRQVRKRTEKQEALSVVITFDPHPLAVLAPDRMPKLLTPLPTKLELIEKSGIDRVLLLPFTKELSLWPPERFVAEVLVNVLKVKAIVVGDNFRFGHRQAGTPSVLQELGRRWGFQTTVVPGIQYRKVSVSSSQIRCLLEEGKAPLANRLLGRPYNLRGSIKTGLGIGRAQAVPTYNLAPQDAQMPAEGVYVTWARIGTVIAGTTTTQFSPPLPSVTNVGVRPTFGDRDLGIETHLLKRWEGTAPYELDVSFLYRLRDERKFNSPEELKRQILRDIDRANAYFRRLHRFSIGALPKT